MNIIGSNAARHMGFPEKIVRILEKMYEGTFSAIRATGGLPKWFETVVWCCKAVCCRHYYLTSS